MLILLLTISLLTLTFHFKPYAEASYSPTTDWNRTYGGTGMDVAYSLVQTSDGGYALTGITLSYGVGSGDFWLVKTDSVGNAQWNRTYGGTNYDYAYSLVQTTDGGYALSGQTASFGVGSGDFWLIKTDSVGNTQWNRTYGGTGMDVAYSLVQTSDGGYALTGITQSYGAGGSDFWLVKTDSVGNAQWNRTYGGTSSDVILFGLVQTSDGGYALGGATLSYGVGSGDFWLVKTDSVGNAQWNRTYGGTGLDLAYSMVQTSDGGYALAGYTNSSGAGNFDFWLVKTDSAGNAQWNKTYGGTSVDAAVPVIQTSDGGYALGGGTQSYGAGGFDAWLVKTDSTGNAQWDKIYGGTGDDAAFSLVQTSDGGYALAGYTNSSGAGNFDFWLVKITPETIYIRADGSVDPPTAPIQRNGDLYTLTSNIYSGADGIVIEKNNVILDGAGYKLQGSGSGWGIDLTNRTSVTVKNIGIKGFFVGINLGNSNNNVISGNTISDNAGAFWLYNSLGNIISGNTITTNYNCSILLSFSYLNRIFGNSIMNNGAGVGLFSSSNNTIYHNNFIGNTWQVQILTSGYNFWDDGYPSGGNYWSDYNGTDLHSGSYQNETGSDGIGDTRYTIDVNNRDNYPLMEPWPAPKAATVIIGTALQITVLDPAKAYDAYTWEVLSNIGEGLLKYEPGTTNLTYGIAENYTVSPNGLNYTFTLRPGMYFTDGEPLDAAAVKWSIDRVVSLNVSGGPSWLVSEYVENVVVLDILTVRFNLKKAVTYFPSLVAETPYFPVSSKSYPAYETASPTVGQYGPYKIRNWTRDVELVLEANPAYYGATPWSKYVVTKYFTNSTMMRQALENGEIDIAWKGLGATDITDLKNDLHFNVVEARGSLVQFIILRCNMTPFDDARLRQAVAAAINRTRIGTEAYGGIYDTLYSMVPMEMWSHIDAFKDEYGVRNLTLARELLTAAGYNESNKLQFDLWYNSGVPTREATANIIKSDLEQTGMISVTLKNAPLWQYIDNIAKGVMPMFLLGWLPDYIDPDNYLTPFVHSTRSPELGVFYNSTLMDAILDNAMVNPNIANRTILYEYAQRLLAEDAPVIPFVQGRQYAVTKPNIKGIYLSLTNLLPYYTIYEVAHLTEYPWSMFRHNLRHTGYTESPAPRTNQTLWNYTTTGIVSSSPAVVDDKVYIGSWDDKVYCLDAATGSHIWNYTTGGDVTSSPAVADGRVYVGSWDHKVYSLDASTGAQIWNYTTGDIVLSSPAVVDGRVYVGSYDYNVYCLDASTGEKIWNYTTGRTVFSSPAVVDGRVYIGSSDNKVYCLDASTGRQIWNYTTGDFVNSSPAVVDGRVYLGSYDRKVYCLNASTGAHIWNYTTGNWVLSSPAVVDGRVYLGSLNGKVYCLDASTGEKLWNYTTSDAVYSSPAIADGKVYVGSFDDKVYCLDALTGAHIWNYITGDAVYSSPAVADGVVYVGSYDNRVYAFGNVIRVPEDYPTVHQAIDAATPGATIIIEPGVYRESIVINKTLTILGKKGSGTEFAGSGSGIAITITGSAASGTIVANIMISTFAQGIVIDNSRDCRIYSNIFSSMSASGIALKGSNAANNLIYSNIFQSNYIGIYLNESSTGNTIFSNTISLNAIGLKLESTGNTIYSNIILLNGIGAISPSINVWDNGYPSGGNYWSDHTGEDLYSGPYQNETGSDGIGDTPYIIDADNKDNYPLMKPYGGSNDIGIIRVALSKTVVGEGCNLKIEVTILNYGIYTETRNIKIYASTTVVAFQDAVLTSRHSTTLTFTWVTSGFAKGTYNIKAYATPITGDVDTTDNNREEGTVIVTIPGDITGDYRCNYKDLGILAVAYGSDPTKPNWNPYADINGDDRVNYKDLGILAVNYGKYSPP